MSLRPVAAVLDEIDWPSRLRDLARRVERNVPDHRQPESFHLEKADIVHELEALAGETGP